MDIASITTSKAAKPSRRRPNTSAKRPNPVAAEAVAKLRAIEATVGKTALEQFQLLDAHKKALAGL